MNAERTDPKYKTIITCPVCGAVMDIIRHHESESNGYTVAILAGDGRRVHKVASPDCAKDSDWMMGWNTETVEATND